MLWSATGLHTFLAIPHSLPPPLQVPTRCHPPFLLWECCWHEDRQLEGTKTLVYSPVSPPPCQLGTRKGEAAPHIPGHGLASCDMHGLHLLGQIPALLVHFCLRPFALNCSFLGFLPLTLEITLPPVTWSKRCTLSQGWWLTPTIPALSRQRQQVCSEFEPARTTHSDFYGSLCY